MKNNYTNILVTGGCGFIASNFIRLIFHKYSEYRIVNLDALTYAGNPNNLIDIEKAAQEDPNKDRYNFIRGNICDRELLDEIFQKYNFKYVIHFAAETHVDRSIFNVSDFIETNINGTRAIIEAVQKYNVSRMVHISTDEVYGDVSKGASTEETLLNPSNPYSASKSAAEMLINAFMKTHRVPAIIIRGSNNYGAYQYPEKLIPLAISNLIDKKKIPIHGQGKQIRSWLHVLDFCSAIDIITHNGKDFEIYNVSGEEKNVLEILELIARSLDMDLEQYKVHVNDRPSADTRYAPDSTKLRSQLFWEPKYSISESMSDIVDWYLKNKAWWEEIKATKEYKNLYERQSKGKWN